MAAGPRFHRVQCGCLVERTRLRHAPVEQDRSEISVTQADSADVPHRRRVVIAGCEFYPAESETLGDLAQRGDPVFVDAGESVPLRPALVVSADIAAPHIREPQSGLRKEVVEPCIQLRAVLLLALEFAVRRHPLPLIRRSSLGAED